MKEIDWLASNSRKKSGENEIIVFENVDITHCISKFCQMIRVINVTVCYTADKMKLGKKDLSFLFTVSGWLKRLSQIVPGARKASKNYYLSHMI